jgi:hypothetical protein
LVAPTVSPLQQRQLRAGVRPFAADNDTHPSRPAAQIEQSGDLGDLGAVADLAVLGSVTPPTHFLSLAHQTQASALSDPS